MDPMNGIWYFLEFQRQAANRSSAEALADPKFQPGEFIKGRPTELVLPLVVLATIVTVAVICFLFPTFQ
jgi:hypothetical protein